MLSTKTEGQNLLICHTVSQSPSCYHLDSVT